MRAVTFTSPVQMQNIAALCVHELLELRLAPLMYQCQINDKSLAQIANFSLGDADVFFTERVPNLFDVATTQKHGYSHIFHNIVAVSGTMRHQLMELLGPEDRPIRTAGTVALCFMGDEVSDTQRDSLAGAGFPYLDGMIASRTMALIGNKGDQWLFRKQGAKRQVALQLLQMAIQTSDEGKSTVFFSSP